MSTEERTPDKPEKRERQPEPRQPEARQPEPRQPVPRQPLDRPTSQRPSKERASKPSKDITPLLKGWDYEPGTINVRKIFGIDGEPKLQMRLELGLLQMEMTGRPDGVRPHGCESLLEYFQNQLDEHTKRHGTELGFHLTADQCQSLREEAEMYYRRYLSLFVLEDFPGVVRDTDRNLRLLDFCGKFAVEEQDRLVLEQFRPYIIMMKARASASIAFKDKSYSDALKTVADALESIREFFTTMGQAEAFGQSNEVRVLKRIARDIRKKMPVDPMQKLQSQLDRAVKSERYEDAARIRDEIRRKSGQA
jgi:hypothetical protein